MVRLRTPASSGGMLLPGSPCGPWLRIVSTNTNSGRESALSLGPLHPGGLEDDNAGDDRDAVMEAKYWANQQHTDDY